VAVFLEGRTIHSEYKHTHTMAQVPDSTSADLQQSSEEIGMLQRLRLSANGSGLSHVSRADSTAFPLLAVTALQVALQTGAVLHDIAIALTIRACCTVLRDAVTAAPWDDVQKRLLIDHVPTCCTLFPRTVGLAIRDYPIGMRKSQFHSAASMAAVSRLPLRRIHLTETIGVSRWIAALPPRVEYVHMNLCHELSFIVQFDHLPLLTTLCITSDLTRHFMRANVLSASPALRRLELRECSTEVPRSFARFTQLQSLTLEYVRLSDDSIIASLPPSLAELTLGASRVYPHSQWDFHHLPRLRKLIVSTNFDQKHIRIDSLPPTLQKLELYTSWHEEVFSTYSHLIALQYLRVGSSYINDAAIATLPASLVFLSILGGHITKDARFGHLTQLRKVELLCEELTSDGLLGLLPRSLTHLCVDVGENLTDELSLAHLTCLQRVNIRGKTLSPATIQSLSATVTHIHVFCTREATFAHLSALQEAMLHVEGGSFNQRAIASLSPSLQRLECAQCADDVRFGHLTALLQADFHDSDISDESVYSLPSTVKLLNVTGCTHLTSALCFSQFTVLQCLHMSGNRVSDATLTSLPPSLIELSVAHCTGMSNAASLGHLVCLKQLDKGSSNDWVPLTMPPHARLTAIPTYTCDLCT
jgi:hypothetical protein